MNTEQRDKGTKSQKDKWTKGQKDKRTKGQRDNETEGQQDKGTNGQRDNRVGKNTIFVFNPDFLGIQPCRKKTDKLQ